MGLRIQRAVSVNNKLIMTLVAAFALVVQPFYGLAASRVANAAEVPQIVNVDAYYVVASYKGIGVDFSVTNLTDATGIEVKVDRTSGGPVVKTAKQPTVESLNAGSTTKTAPIVIQQGSYNEAGSGSWNQPEATWTHQTLPTAVTVTITRGGGESLVMTKPLGENNGPFATRSQVMPPLPPNTAPQVAFMSPTPAENTYVRGVITPRATASDDYGMGSYYVRVWKNNFESGSANLVYDNCYSAPGALLLGTWQDVTCGEFDTKGVSDGKYVISAQFLDGGSLWGQSLRTITVDNTLPKVEFQKSIEGKVLHGDVHTRSRVANEAGMVHRVTYIDGVEFKNETASGVTGKNSEIKFNTNNYADGIRVVRVVATDEAGNTSEASQSFTVDNTKPTIKVNLNRAGYVSSGGIVGPAQKPEIEAFDKHLKRIEVWRGDSKVTEWTNVTQNSVTRKGISWITTDGTYTIRAYDDMGLVSDDFQLVINKAPGATIVSPGSDNQVVRQDILVRGEAVVRSAQIKSHWFEIINPDGSTSYSYNMNTQDTNHEFMLDTSRGDGVYAIRYVVTDTEGRRSDSVASATRTVVVDKTAPTVAVTDTLRQDDNSYIIKGTTNDSASVGVRINGEVVGTTSPNSGSWEFRTGILAPGTYQVSAISTDGVGNVGTSASRSFTVPVLLPDDPGTLPTGPGIILFPEEEPDIEPDTEENLNVTPASLAFIASAPQIAAAFADNNEEVLGVQTDDNDRQSIFGNDTSDVLGVTASPKNADGSWNLLGLAWYWWLVAAAAVIGVGWWLIAAIRRRQDEAADI